MSSSTNSAGLAQLKDTIHGYKYNTTLMLSRLQRFEERLANIDTKMRPIQVTTENYSKAKENIASTLQEVSKTYEFFRIAADVKVIINQGYKPTTQKHFFEALGRLSQAKKFFEDHREIKSSMTVLMTIDTLLRNAVMQCVAELERLLVPLGKTVEVDDDGNYQVINPLSASISAELKSLFALFDKHNQKLHYEVYQGIRIAQVKAELQAEEDAHASDWATLEEDVPYIKGSHPLQRFLSLAYEMLRGELQLWSNSLNPANPQAVQVFAAICDATVMEIQRLLIPMLLDDEQEHSSNFIIRQANSLLIRLEMLDMYNSKYDDMLEICRPELGKPSHASVTLTALRDAMVEACVDSINVLLSSSSDSGDPIDVENNSEFKKSFKQGEIIAIANPGESCDLHPITGNVLHCCKELRVFGAVYSRVCELVSEIGATHCNFPYMYASDLPDLVTSLVDNLFDALQQRADRYNVIVPPNAAKKRAGENSYFFWPTKAYDSAGSGLDAKHARASVAKARRHLFLANNMYSLYVYCTEMQKLHSIALSDGAPLPVIVNDLDRVLRDVEAILVSSQNDLCYSVAAALGVLPDDISFFQQTYAQKRADKKAVEKLLKTKFSAFNCGMDALLAQQGEWRVTSLELRENISAQLVEQIVPIWTSFFNTFSATQFSKKHMKEYLRFPPHDVNGIIKHYFG